MKTIGIVGGMGPEATCDLYLKIIRNTPADKDQDHIRTIIDSNPKIPDRTAFILGQGPDPRPLLIETARNVERAGASFWCSRAILPIISTRTFRTQLEYLCSI